MNIRCSKNICKNWNVSLYKYKCTYSIAYSIGFGPFLTFCCGTVLLSLRTILKNSKAFAGRCIAIKVSR